MRRTRRIWNFSGRKRRGFTVVVLPMLAFLAFAMIAGLTNSWVEFGPQKASLMKSSPQSNLSIEPTDDGASELTWHWRYDGEGRLVEIVGPGRATARIIYAQSRAEAGGAGRNAVEFGDERREFKWDAEGRLLSAKGAGGTIGFNYNWAGLPVEVRSESAPTIGYTYDIQDRLVETRIGRAAVIQYRYDYLGRLAAIATPAGDITYSYQRVANRVVRRLPNGLQTIREFDDEGRLIELVHVDSESYIIAEYAYVYRPDGLIEGITERSRRAGERVCRYGYDLMQRLTAVECGGQGHSYRYGYDSLGNLAESQAADGEALRFSSTPAGALATDSRGDSRVDERGHIRRLPGSPESIDYEFNGAGDLSAAKGQSLRYSYNALGLVTGRTVGGRETRFLPDPFVDAWQPLWRRNVDGTEDVIVWDGAVPLVELRGAEARYRLEDHLGSVRVEVDGSGVIVAWHDYTPYGAPEETVAGDDLVPAFAGLFWDPVARVYLATARAYDPVTARFLQPDPQLRVPGASKHSHSLYAYSGGDPVNFVDRNGAEAVTLDSHAIWWDAFGRSLSKWRKPEFSIGRRGAHATFPPPTDMAQRFDDGSAVLWDGSRMQPGEAKRFFVNTVKSYELAELRENYGGKDISKLSESDQAKVRNKAVAKFAENFSDYPGHRVDINGPYYKDFNQYVANMNILTEDGWSSVDWTTATWDSKRQHRWLPADPGRRLKFGKVLHNIVSPRIGQKEFPEGSVFEIPQNNVNAIRLIERLGNMSPASAVFVPRGTMGVSVVASSRPLTASEYASWKTSRFRRDSASQKIQLDRWNKLISSGGAASGGGPSGLGGGSGPGGGSSFSKLSPSPVGGVYLGGAGKTLEGLGRLKGVAVDEATGKLVLIGSDDEKLALPPLGLDEVVTVFRAVYDHGRPPSVTIDPDERNPRGPIMHVKHGPGTAATYVGWILFECDRIMKTYQLGKDNVTGETVNSRVPDHAKTLEAVFFGDRMHEGAGSIWERFWIVPDTVRRFDAATGDLSLFELPLKVNTQKMRWTQDRLVDDETGESSIGARAFKRWFTKHYGKIADEVLLTPPPGSGVEGPIAIFHELRRIALVTAVAEHLRNLGETMPAWMRDYPVASFPVPETTPSLTIEKRKPEGSAIRISNIYGGVNLAPADRDVHAYSDPKVAGAAPVPSEAVAFVDLARQEAAFLSAKIPELARADEAIGTVQPITMPDGSTLSAVLLPSADTRALAPNRQEVTDLVVPIGLGRSIDLTRYYNSFFDPVGALGKGWTLDLPQLLMTQVPVSREGQRSQYRIVPQLVSPLGTVDIRFDSNELVEPYGIEMPVAKNHPEIAGVARGHSDIVGTMTHQVLFRDGSEWHFDDDGRLVLVQAEGTATRYVRDSAGHVRQILGYVGRDAVAEIRLGYDRRWRIVRAEEKQADYLHKQVPAQVSGLEFEYGGDGRLSAVVRPRAGEGEARRVEWAYTYEAGHLLKIDGADGIEASFGYDERGQLLWEKQEDRKAEYTVATTPQGTMLTKSMGEGGALSERWTYDARMRPLKADLVGGRTVRWRYGKDHEVWETLSRDGKPILTRSTSQDGNTSTTVLADGPTYDVRRGSSGLPRTLSIDGALAVQLSWRPDGTIAMLRYGDTELQPRRHEDGWPNGVLISAPMASGKTNQWLEEEWDVMGRPIKITDSSGFDYRMSYDSQGRLRTFGRLTEDGKLMGTNLVYDDEGLVTGVDSSWDKEKREYAHGGVLKKIEVERQGAKSVTTLDAHGHQTKLVAFDGGTTTWRYDSDEAKATLRAIELPNRGQIDYRWSTAGESGGGEVRLGPAVISMRFDANGRMATMTWGEQIP